MSKKLMVLTSVTHCSIWTTN